MKIKIDFKKNKLKSLLTVIFLIIVIFFTVDNAELDFDIDKGEFEIKEVEKNDVNGYYKVEKVVDGDTIDVLIGSEKKRIRLLGVDTPESVDPRKKVECYGREASEALKNLLFQKNVRLEKDASQQDIDKYGRLLRYVYLENGVFVNQWLLENGFADRYYCHPQCQYADDFQQSLKKAKKNSLGLWGECFP